MSVNYPFTTTCILVFSEMEDKDVLFFTIYADEYGTDCHESERGSVYITHIDSVNVFQPKELRTRLFHEILMTYMGYVMEIG